MQHHSKIFSLDPQVINKSVSIQFFLCDNALNLLFNVILYLFLLINYRLINFVEKSLRSSIWQTSCYIQFEFSSYEKNCGYHRDQPTFICELYCQLKQFLILVNFDLVFSLYPILTSCPFIFDHFTFDHANMKNIRLTKFLNNHHKANFQF